MYAKTFGTVVVGTGLALALTACGPADGGPSTSPAPAFSTIPASTPMDTGYAAQVMREFRYAHDRCGNAPSAGNAVDPVQCSRASGMIDTLPTPCISGSPDVPADVEKCAAALRGSARPSAAPATATAAPATVPTTPVPLHDDPTATMTVADLFHALDERGVLPINATKVVATGKRTITYYAQAREICDDLRGSATPADYEMYCGSRDTARRTLPARCVVEAERATPAPDASEACGLALAYVEKVTGK
ncbi:hypothetical protein TSOC111612_24100 [Tsukamurella ocularis]|uniref:hypothetical protein n=1 Tax=Tsukamurella ocularis TaxID=1970234 RepID=UPI0039EFFC0B